MRLMHVIISVSVHMSYHFNFDAVYTRYNCWVDTYVGSGCGKVYVVGVAVYV